MESSCNGNLPSRGIPVLVQMVPTFGSVLADALVGGSVAVVAVEDSEAVVIGNSLVVFSLIRIQAKLVLSGFG